MDKFSTASECLTFALSQDIVKERTGLDINELTESEVHFLLGDLLNYIEYFGSKLEVNRKNKEVRKPLGVIEMKASSSFSDETAFKALSALKVKDYKKQLRMLEHAEQLKASGKRFNVDCVARETLLKNPYKQYMVMDNIPDGLDKNEILSNPKSNRKYLCKFIEIILKGTEKDIKDFEDAITI